MGKKIFIRNSEFEYEFPMEDVEACMKRVLDSSKYKYHNSCPKCGLESEKLTWIDFESPDWTWEELCGRQGPFSICPDSKIQVEFIIESMN